MKKRKMYPNRILVLLLTLVMMMGVIPVTSYADDSQGNTGYHITYTSNNMERFNQLFQSDNFKWNDNNQVKKEGKYTYDFPVYDASGGSYKDIGSAYTIDVKDVSDLQSISFTYGNKKQSFRLEDALANPSHWYYLERGYAPGYLNPAIYVEYSGGDSCRILFNYFNVSENVNISFNYALEGTLNAKVETTDSENTASIGWTYGKGAGQYLVYAVPKAGWYVERWESSYNEKDFFEIDDSKEQKYLPVTPTGEETTYRAVMAPYSWKDAKVTVSSLNQSDVNLSLRLSSKVPNLYSLKNTVTLPYSVSIGDLLDCGDDFLIDLSSVSPSNVEAYIVTIGEETTILTANNGDLRGESYNLKSTINSRGVRFRISDILNSLGRKFTADQGIDIKIVYDEPNAKFKISTITNNEEYGTVNKAYPANGQYLLSATPKDGYAIAWWETAEGENAEEGFRKIDNSDGQKIMLVDADKDTTYKAVFVPANEKAVDFISSKVGINSMEYVNEPQRLMWNNYPGNLPNIPVMGSTQSFFASEGSVMEADPSRIAEESSVVEAGKGANLWFTFRYYSDLTGVKVKIYKGESTDEANLIKVMNDDELAMGTGNFAGTGICYMPVSGMPYTDKVTVVFDSNGVSAQKTLELKSDMKESQLDTEKIEASDKVVDLYDSVLADIKSSSVTYRWSSKYLMIQEELTYGLKEIAGATTKAKIDSAKEKALRNLMDTASGIYHHGVDCGVVVKDTLQVVRVPEISCAFDVMCAALEQAYPNGHWYYSVGGSQFGIYFNGAGYLVDNSDRPGVRVDGGPVSGGYGVSDYKGNRDIGMANGVSNQCVWEGLCTNTPNEFYEEDSPETLIKLNRANQNDITWDLARLLQHYSAEELFADPVYKEAMKLQNAPAQESAKAYKSLQIKYLDFLFIDETDATRDVIRSIGSLTKGSDPAIIREAYGALSQNEKDGVFNYVDLITFEQAKLIDDQNRAAEVDKAIKSINAIGEVSYTDEIRQKIREARAAYENASEEAKALVTNIDILTAAEASFHKFEEEKVKNSEDAKDSNNSISGGEKTEKVDISAKEKTNSNSQMPATGESSLVTFWILMMICSFVALYLICIKKNIFK